ncbi:MAG: hypothetical protein ACRENF_05065 [Thermodesulfobacteriota bacterium]
MSSKFWEKKKFRAIQNEWYQKLKEAGFEDIETDNNKDHFPVLKEWSSIRFRLRCTNEISRATTEQFYTNLKQVLDTFPFLTDFDRNVWKEYSEGRNTEEIARSLGVTSYFVKRTIYQVKINSRGMIMVKDTAPVNVKCSAVFAARAVQVGGYVETTVHKIPRVKLFYSKGEGVLIHHDGVVSLIPIGNLLAVTFEEEDSDL